MISNKSVTILQVFSGNYSNLVLSPFGLATTLSITMDCVQGEPYEEIAKLFKLQSKTARQELRAGFKTILEDFRVKLLSDSLLIKFTSTLKQHLTPFLLTG